MSEAANGAEVEFVRLYIKAHELFVEVCSADGRTVHLTDRGDEACVFVSPAPALLESLREFFGEVECRPATFAEWVAQKEPAT